MESKLGEGRREEIWISQGNRLDNNCKHPSTTATEGVDQSIFIDLNGLDKVQI